MPFFEPAERHSVNRVYDGWHFFMPRSGTANDSGLGTVRVDHVGLMATNAFPESAISGPVCAWTDGSNQFGHSFYGKALTLGTCK